MSDEELEFVTKPRRNRNVFDDENEEEDEDDLISDDEEEDDEEVESFSDDINDLISDEEDEDDENEKSESKEVDEDDEEPEPAQVTKPKSKTKTTTKTKGKAKVTNPKRGVITKPKTSKKKEVKLTSVTIEKIKVPFAPDDLERDMSESLKFYNMRVELTNMLISQDIEDAMMLGRLLTNKYINGVVYSDEIEAKLDLLNI